MSPTRGAVKRLKLTPWQRQVYEMRHSETPAVTWAEVTRRLDRPPNDRPNIKRAYKRAAAIIEIGEGTIVPSEQPEKRIEKTQPDHAAILMQALTDPLRGKDHFVDGIYTVGRQAGIPSATIRRFAERMCSLYFPMLVEAREVRTRRLRDLWETRVEQALAAMTTDKFDEASLRDLAVVAGVGIDKIQLLRGLPTEIVRTESDRSDLRELIAGFLAESKRRGYEIEINPSDASASLVHKKRQQKVPGLPDETEELHHE